LRIISRKTLIQTWNKHPETEQQLRAWFAEIKKSKWASLHEIKGVYPSASILRDNRVVFNIKGNKYRLIAKFNFEYQLCWIRFVGTHADYDKIDAQNI
jgi:mRNA interferase HigB